MTVTNPSPTLASSNALTFVVNSATPVLTASTPAGLFHGVQTVRQLLPVPGEGGSTIPAVEIEDAPRFARWAFAVGSAAAVPFAVAFFLAISVCPGACLAPACRSMPDLTAVQ